MEIETRLAEREVVGPVQSQIFALARGGLWLSGVRALYGSNWCQARTPAASMLMRRQGAQNPRRDEHDPKIRLIGSAN